ncbi:uncharacterized protein LOC134716049 isoform X2 [Mytilus trossulus]|uniref:uncharacterized protein LOC134716049 isoform X2 n=1 Tax=Mytilus trossulus TaxID=6551 RepID=UPI003004B04E
MNLSGYDNLPDESPIGQRHKRKDSTRELNGSYILACRGEESLETSGFDPLSPVSSKGRPKVHKDLTVYSSVALDESDYTNNTTEELKPKRSRIIHDSIADKSLPNPHNTTDAPHCRICHEGDEEEDLLSPCFCSGSVGALHMSCLEKWLGASDKTRCEICGFQFSISKNPKPVTWFLKNKSLGRERRYLIADIGCAIWFTPFTIGSFTGCMIGASYFTSVDKDWQATTLILLAMINLLIFSLWCGFTIRRNYILCSTWRENFQEIKIKYNPPDKNNNKQTVSRGSSVTDRMLLENSFKTVHAGKTSPEFPAKPIIRKITYETSPKHRKQHCHIELEEEDSTLQPGTPYPKRKQSSKMKRCCADKTMTETLPPNELTILEGKKVRKVRNKRVDHLQNNSTSTPAKTNSGMHNIFDENHCSATPIQLVPYQNIQSDIIYANPAAVDHPGMFVETPFAIVHTNVATQSMTRQGLIFQAPPKARRCEEAMAMPPDDMDNGIQDVS